METKFIWNVIEMERNPSDNYVFTVHFVVNGFEGEFNSQIFDSVQLDRPEELIDFNSLTEEIVVGWIKNIIGENGISLIEEELKNIIENKKNPKVLFGLPW